MTQRVQALDDSLAADRRELGDDHPATLQSAADLAVVFAELGDVPEARALGEDTLARQQAIGVRTGGNRGDPAAARRAGGGPRVTATVREQLDAARRLADDLGDDQVRYHLTFGPANTRIHAVAAHLELGEVGEAVALGQGFSPPASVPPTRAGHHYLDLARAHLTAGDREAALRALLHARRIVPEQTRYHPMVREPPASWSASTAAPTTTSPNSPPGSA